MRAHPIESKIGPNFVNSHGQNRTQLTFYGSLDFNQLCGLDLDGRGTYTSDGIDKICTALKVNSTLQSLRYDFNPKFGPNFVSSHGQS